MSTRILIRLLWIVSLGSLFLVIIPYVWNFHSNGYSKNSAQWAQFGDYIGGVLNPIFALLNLIVLTYLTIKVVQNEDERNRFTLQELARPLGDIYPMREKERIDISFWNLGLGPLKIKKMTVTYKGADYSSYKDIFTKPPITSGIEWEYWQIIEGEDSIVGKDKSLIILNFSVINKTGSMPLYLKTAYEILHQTKLTLEYTDIYDRPMPKASFDFNKINDPTF